MKLSIFSKLITLLLLGSCAVGMQADFVSLSIWERTTTTGEKQHLVCLGDRHALFSQADKQSDDLINWLKQRNNAHDIVLLEDTYNAKDMLVEVKKYCKEYIPGWNESYLQDVKEKYHNDLFAYEDLPAFIKVALKSTRYSTKSLNIDFRLLEDKFTCLSQYWQHFLSHELHDFVIKQIIKEVQCYSDSPFLNDYYQRCIKPLSSVLKESGSVSKQNILKLLTDHNGKPKILDFLPHQNSFYYKLNNYSLIYDYYDRNELAGDLLCELMDARLLHHIYQEHILKDQANVVAVCAGASHIWNIETKLDKLGYARIYKDGASSHDDANKGIVLSRRLKDSLDKLPAAKMQAKL